MLTDPGVVHELVKEEEIRTRQLVHKYSEKMKQFGVRTINRHCYRLLNAKFEELSNNYYISDLLNASS